MGDYRNLDPDADAIRPNNLQCASGDDGKMMLEGEYTSLCTFDAACPGLVPSVLGLGEFQTSPENCRICFLIEDFLQLDSQTMPDPEDFATRIVGMHCNGRSPGGKFGFPVTTCDGPLPHPVAW